MITVSWGGTKVLAPQALDDGTAPTGRDAADRRQRIGGDPQPAPVSGLTPAGLIRMHRPGLPHRSFQVCHGFRQGRRGVPTEPIHAAHGQVTPSTSAQTPATSRRRKR